MSVEFRDTSRGLRDTLLGAIANMRGSRTSLREILDLVGEQGLLLLCAILTLPFLIPISIPGVSTVFGAAIILLSVAVTLNRAPWIPQRILDKGIDADKLKAALEKGADILRRIEAYTRPRMHRLTQGAVMGRINGLALVAGGVLLMLPLGLIPFSNTLPALSILFFAIGISQRDGLLVLVGYLMLVATVVYFAALAVAAYMAGTTLSDFFAG